ncbi:MAG: ornithine carbamoyltransferase [Planctomycetaceae bacterium]|nr:ornithine carbamoyltransferase [Planctomycetaceae bacterium]
MRHLLTLFDLQPMELEAIFTITRDLKEKFAAGLREPILPGRVLAMLFERPSLRTRVSFEAAILQLGGGSLFLGEDVGFGSRESVEDCGRVLGQFVDVIVSRTREHQRLVEFASHCACSVINGLSEQAHPCQALADLYTIREQLGGLKSLRLAWIGDGNNVARSLAVGCAKMGYSFVAASPPGYQLEASFLEEVREAVPGAEVEQIADPREAVEGAEVIYTDVWASMGQEAEKQARAATFAAYQVNNQLMTRALKQSIFMHCMPAHRDMEVTAEVLDGPQSVVLEQAANRMHVQKGLLAWLLGKRA